MKPNRIIGIALVIIGVALLVIGVNSSNSIADQISDTFRGRFTDSTTWYIVGGIAVGLVGLMLTAVGFRGKSA